jgi:hypothetical protein
MWVFSISFNSETTVKITYEVTLISFSILHFGNLQFATFLIGRIQIWWCRSNSLLSSAKLCFKLRERGKLHSESVSHTDIKCFKAVTVTSCQIMWSVMNHARTKKDVSLQFPDRQTFYLFSMGVFWTVRKQIETTTHRRSSTVVLLRLFCEISCCHHALVWRLLISLGRWTDEIRLIQLQPIKKC